MPTSKKQKWFCEKLVPGKRFGNIRHCFLIDKLIYQGKTKFQKILIFDNPVYGRVFCLDDIIELSESDEFIYHEMISHPFLFSHPKPENILIIGGGDGGALREVLKHPVKKVDLVEIDNEVIDISKKYLKFVCQSSFSDKRVKIQNLSGEKFIKDYKNYYDVIIIDCTNPSPESFSSPLYSLKFYNNIFNALKDDGIMVTLGASFLDFNSYIRKIFWRLKKIFPLVTLYRYCMPSYHCGEYCFIGASKKINLEKVNFNKIEENFKKLQKKANFKYYSPQIHKASMVLPKIWQP